MVIGTNVQAYDADLTALSSCQTGGAAALALLTATEVAILDGATLSTAELNYVDGVTSAIQTQLNTKGVTAGSSSITTVGTVAAGTWQGTAIASAYLDADTAHLTTNQTLSGEKTFTADLVVTTANHSVTVDVSEDEMILAGDTKLSFNDANGGENISADAGGTLVVNAGTILDAVAPTIDLNASTKIIVNSPIMQMFSGTTAKPLISLECTNPDALGGTFQFVKNGASVADNDVIGTVKFVSEDDGDVVHTYSTIESTIDDMTGGQESGKLKLSVASHDGGVEQGLLLSGGSVDAEVDVTIGNGAASVTTVAGDLTVSGGDILIGGATPKLTIGDAGEEDTMLVFDGNAQDYRIGLDDGTDVLEIGIGAAHGTTPALIILPDTSIEIFDSLSINKQIADENVSGITAAFAAGEDLVRGEAVYFKAGDSKMWKAVATASATSRCVALAADDISANGVGRFLLQGFIRDNGSFPAYTIGATLFTPEAETASQNVPEEAAPDTDGDFVQVLGWAVTNDMIFFNPSNDIIEVA